MTWGWGENHQLGHGDTATRPAPTVVQTLRGLHIEQVSAGAYHTLARAADGTVYAWGSGQYGQLGLGAVQVQPTPARVDLPEPALRVHAGWWHNVAMCGLPAAAAALRASPAKEQRRGSERAAAAAADAEGADDDEDGDDAAEAAGTAAAAASAGDDRETAVFSEG
jgi:hypothetical protein